MKLPLPAILLFLFCPGPLANPLHVSAPSLSAPTKKPASLAGFLYLILIIAHLNGSFPSATLFLARLAPNSAAYSNSK